MTDPKIVQKIKREYIAGRGSQRSLARKYGVSETQVEKMAGRERWRELREKAKKNAGEKIAENVAAQAAKSDEQFFALVDQLVQLTAMAMNRMGSTEQVTPTAVEHFANTVATIQKIKGIQSSLDTQEQQAKIDKLRKEIENSGKQDAEEIVIELGGAAAWAK